MYSPFLVKAIDPNTGKVIAKVKVSDSHEEQDAINALTVLFPLAKIETTPR